MSRIRRTRTRPSELLLIWLAHHLRSARESLRRLFGMPLPTTMTVAVLGISLALPATLYVGTDNLRAMTGRWDQTAAISLFLRHEVDSSTARALAERLRARPELARVELIEPDQALAEFKELGGFEGALEALDDNPLPAVLALYPTPRHATSEQLRALEQQMVTLPEADFARMDTLWIERLQAILALAEAATLLLGALLGLGVLLIVGNTIRLEILNRRGEIEIMELVGATAAFIRRPFLYAGAWYGLLGGLCATLLVTFSSGALQGSVSRLAALYGGEFRIAGLGLDGTLVVLLAGIALGLVGSWIAVGRHLRGAEAD
ncbi:permease-like cell division protein FtsX [Marichromatium gracile]|uniref:Cell division protein FtsX n=1 Tax=Marichromatium gracile TaxID=1048 RepID=A0ABR5VI24_MARGR|nr:permease-like cell division protein FtsX [Marichromatium gracile]KXX64966.1 cell division protein [Marichromatium gracile]